MTIDELKQAYTALGGSETDEWHVFFDNTPEEQSIFVPGCSFVVSQEQNIMRGVCTLPGGEQVVVQDDNEEALPSRMQLAAIVAMLSREDASDFMCRLLLGRMIVLEEEIELTQDQKGFMFVRDNITAQFDGDTLTVKQDEQIYDRVKFENTEVLLKEFAELLLEISELAMSSIAQDELIAAILEERPDLAQHISKTIDIAADHSICYHIKMPAPTDENMFLWVIIDQDGATVGMNGNSLCDDIGLHIRAVETYINAIMQERVLLVTEYKNQENYENSDYSNIEWIDAPADPQVLEDRYAKKSRGLGKLVNKGRIVDIFSWNGTFSMTLKL